jgi:transcriptional regulator GlxA family with amidase domain
MLLLGPQRHHRIDPRRATGACDGEPHFRELEPARQLAQPRRRLADGGMNREARDHGMSFDLLRGLADAHLVSAMRQMHGQLARSWTIAQLAKTAGLSRSAFFERFQRTVALPPMEYLLAWRMAVAKDLLRRHDLSVGEVAERVGYGSASTFSTAFSRHVGRPPGRYARG